MIYLDTSALAKLIIEEDGSAALRAWLVAGGRPPMATSVIGAAELRRVAARFGQPASDAAVLLLARVDLLEVTPAVTALAGSLPPPVLRMLDALHIASAAQFADLSAVVTYDARMAEAALAYGLPCATP